MVVLKNIAGEIRNKVIIAYLQALYDLLDYDGMKSILKEANLLEIKNYRDVDPEGNTDFRIFQEIIEAQNCLLYGCTDLLIELGKKFAFYLFPFGKPLSEILFELNELVDVDWSITVEKQSEEEIIVKVQNCIFMCESEKKYELLIGFILQNLENVYPPSKRFIYTGMQEVINNKNMLTTFLKFKIEDIN
ncbi:MAG: hypothetical protein ACTSQP_21800 [Promethearchaeota archaeon]